MDTETTTKSPVVAVASNAVRSTDENEGQSGPSKRSLKRKERMEARKKFWREKKKQKQKEKSALRKQQREAVEKAAAEGITLDLPITTIQDRKSKRKEKIAGEDACNVVFDLSFDAKMTPQEIKHVVAQLAYSYSANRKSDLPWKLHVTSFGGQTKADISSKFPYDKWKNLFWEEKSYMDAFEKDKLVYLTSDSPNVIETITPDKYYIIGAIVDRNRLKGATYNQAVEQGIATARLPIDEYLDMSTRKVLTINHVFEILLKFSETKDWKTSLLTCIPQRKGAAEKGEDDEDAKDT